MHPFVFRRAAGSGGFRAPAPAVVGRRHLWEGLDRHRRLFAGGSHTGSALRGQVGARVADTFAGGGDSATGTITSSPFTVDRNCVYFLIGGGRHPLGVEPATSVQLLVDGVPVRTATGEDSGELRPIEWDLRELAGKTAQFQILDDATGRWGHLMVDHVVLAD